MEAIRSLKMSKLDTNTELASYYKQDPQGISIVGNIYKAKKQNDHLKSSITIILWI